LVLVLMLLFFLVCALNRQKKLMPMWILYETFSFLLKTKKYYCRMITC
jgi:hypothetical protein